jgi:hypothetical protein
MDKGILLKKEQSGRIGSTRGSMENFHDNHRFRTLLKDALEKTGQL